jgi:hypothetical protein
MPASHHVLYFFGLKKALFNILVFWGFFLKKISLAELVKSLD